MRYETQGWTKHVEKDNWQTGCYGGGAMLGGADSFSADTVFDLIDQCADFVGCDDDEAKILDSCDEIGRLDIQVMENDDGVPARQHEIEKWKAGEIDLWLATYTFQIEAVMRQPVALS